MRCCECHEDATCHVTLAQSRRLVDERHFCERHLEAFLAAHAQSPVFEPTRQHRSEDAVAFDIEMVVHREDDDEQLVVLRELGGTRSLPIMCGELEALAMDLRLRRLRSSRPLTHDAWASTIGAFGGELQDVLVTDHRREVFYARLRIRERERLVEVDVRPTDAFILAMVYDVPILISYRLIGEVCP